MTLDVVARERVSATGPNVMFTVGDHGGAFVSMLLFIPELAPEPFHHDETFFGDRTWSMPMPPGRYRAHFQLAAFAKGALNRSYRSFVTVDGQPAVTAEGNLPEDVPADDGFVSFDIVVGATAGGQA